MSRHLIVKMSWCIRMSNSHDTQRQEMIEACAPIRPQRKITLKLVERSHPLEVVGRYLRYRRCLSSLPTKYSTTRVSRFL